MITLKFGGSSMANAERIINSVDIILSRAKQDRISVVVSAVQGVSNKLQESIDACIAGSAAQDFIDYISKTHTDIIKDLEKKVSGYNAKAVKEKMQPYFVEYERLLTAVVYFGECPTSVHCRIMGLGELWCVPMIEEVLRAKKQNVLMVDARKFIFTTGMQAEGDPDYAKTAIAFAPYKDGGSASQFDILLITGFICSWTMDGKVQMGLLGRNGSDFSAAIVAVSLESKKLELWTDVDGIYSADPRIVSDAILVNDMTYEEAMELSFFGSKVLHPKTLAPLSVKGIEAWSLNSYNPTARGTRIGTGPYNTNGPVRGISCLKDTAMVSVSGAGMKGRPGTAARVFSAISRGGISVLLITQSSSEYTISFCVRQCQAKSCREILTHDFEDEIREGYINPIEVWENAAIVSIVGDGMKQKRGIASCFFEALASRDINIQAIAQGSSERSISCVISGENGDVAVRTAHRFFFDTNQTIELFLFGTGTIGGCLLDQVRDQQQELLSQKIDIRVMAIANINGMLLSEEGLDLTNWNADLQKATHSPTLDTILQFVKKVKPLNPIFVDCTASYDLPKRYLEIFQAGMHIATPNKRANSMSMEYYHQLRTVANSMSRRFLYETNVGAGLPVIDTLQNQFKSGDSLVRFTGIMSGSLSYIFGRLDEGATFSQAVLEAREKRFTEPDPRDDLSGLDVARKALIIAREAGMELELEDIKINRVFPDFFDDSGTVEEFLQKLPSLDEYFTKKIADLRKKNMVLRMAASIFEGKCTVGCLEVGSDDPLYTIRGGENAFVFLTKRYTPIPLTVRGYGAGAAVTAAGVFGDILRTVSWNMETK